MGNGEKSRIAQNWTSFSIERVETGGWLKGNQWIGIFTE